MEDILLHYAQIVDRWVWGPPLIILLVGTGIYLTILLRGIQFRGLWRGMSLAFIKKRGRSAPGDISHFQALMTALAATVGVGNIAGVATAIALGGPGALFWMWITALFGMATKYAEAVLGIVYRRKDARGEMCGGPMYYLRDGLGMPRLGAAFAVCTVLASFGIGNMVQANTVAAAIASQTGIAPWVSGIVLVLLTAVVVLGGIRSIARFASVLVPVMVVVYVAAAGVIVLLNLRLVPGVLSAVLRGAFNPVAAVGGFAGTVVMRTIQIGIARGLFSNESGLGSAPIVAAAARTSNPVAQALVSMTQTFIDTIIVCSMTGFVIIASGAWQDGLTGSELTVAAFSRFLPGSLGSWVVVGGLVLCAYSTRLGWGYYGEKALEFLWGERVIKGYRVFFCLLIYAGAVRSLDFVWTFSDITNGCMAFPNLVALLLLSKVVAQETRQHFGAGDAISRAG